MTKTQQLIAIIKLKIQILQIQLRIKLLKEKLTIPGEFKVKYIILHHEAGENGFLSVNEYHKQKWGFKSSLGYYAGYTFYFDRQLKWWQARAIGEETAACPGHNKDAIQICVQGNYEFNDPDESMMKEVFKKVDELREQYNIPKDHVFGDKEMRIPTRATKCPCRMMSNIEEYKRS